MKKLLKIKKLVNSKVKSLGELGIKLKSQKKIKRPGKGP